MQLRMLIATLAILFMTATTASQGLAHGGGHDHKMICKKNGKVIKVKGKTDDAKKASCEAKGGTWEQSDDE